MPAGLRSLLVGFASLVLIGAMVVIVGWSRYTQPGPLTESRTIIIPRGAGVAEIAGLLWRAGVLTDPYSFQLGVRIDDAASRLRSGEYAFPVGASPHDAAMKLASGQTVVRRLTVAEGLTTSQALALIREVSREVGSALLLVSHDEEVLRQFDLRRDFAEINQATASRAA